MPDKKDMSFDNEYSRLIGAVGKETLLRIQSTNILIYGLKGLGIEIAKNVALMGVKNLTIYDPEPVTLSDLSGNFFLTEEDVGQPRAQACFTKLKELNERVHLVVQSEPITDEVLKKFYIVVLTNNRSTSELIRLTNFCHENKIHVIVSDVRGLFGYIFVDFGEQWIVTDPTGEEPKTGYLEAITQDKEALCTMVHGEKHDLEDGDVIRITEVKGMTEVNGREFKVVVKTPGTFSIGDTSSFSNYISGGYFEQVKQPKTVTNSSFSSFLDRTVPFDKYQIMDWAKFDRPALYHLFIRSLLAFQDQHHGATPLPYHAAHQDEVLNHFNEFNAKLPEDERIKEVNSKLVKLLAATASGELSPMAAFFGGLIAQEVIKGCSGKYTPIDQWFFFDSLESLPDEEHLPTPESAASIGCRYDGQIAVFGREFQEKLSNLRYFLVGAGAIGCESLKNFALMGVGTGPQGLIHVTDMDQIEISNLNRQFLYRSHDVHKFKSEVAATAALKMNPQLNLKTYTAKVGPETENLFDDAFWESLSGVQNALDNIPARLYIDSRCVFFHKSLLESGTLGTKGNTQVVVPKLTESYGSSPDPPQKQTPMCTLHSFPNVIQHCLQWAREDMFEGLFVTNPELVNSYLENPDFFSTVSQTSMAPTLSKLKALLIDEKPKDFDDCIRWARLEYEKQYDNRIRQLLYNFPKDYVDSNGAAFWSAGKRAPEPLKFNPSDPYDIDFIVSASFLRAYNYGILHSELKPADFEQQIPVIMKKAAAVVVPPFKPKAGIKIETDEKATAKPEDAESSLEDDDQALARIRNLLPTPASLANWRMRPLEFEKDDDNNFHIDFINAASNLRAKVYTIPTVDRLKSKLIAGRIIPAIVTTTAAVTGLIGLEFYKLHQGHNKLVTFKNSFLNLALPMFQQSDPLAAPKTKFLPLGSEFTLWDRIHVRLGDVTLQRFIDWFHAEYKMTVDMIGVGVALIYSDWVDPAKKKERLGKTVSQLVQEIGKVTFHPKQRYFSLEITGCTEDGKEVEDMPDVTFWFR